MVFDAIHIKCLWFMVNAYYKTESTKNEEKGIIVYMLKRAILIAKWIEKE